MGVENKKAYKLDLAGFSTDILISTRELDQVHRPLVHRLSQLAIASPVGRCIALLAGSPGAGKTSISALWEVLAQEEKPHVPFQTLPMDGFHYPNTIIDSKSTEVDSITIPLRRVKGSPETFDIKSLIDKIRYVRYGISTGWPVYDRRIHDPIPDAIQVINQGVIMIEGNYLLLDEPGWRDIKGLADFSIFLACDVEDVREGVIARHIRGGRNPEEARVQYDFNDRRNHLRIMDRRLPTDVVLKVSTNHTIDIDQ